MSQKRIGFVDYNLDNFHANVFLKGFREELPERGFVVAGCHGLIEAEGKEWGAKNDIPYFESPDELNENVDYYAVLAPSNPEVHLELCQRVFPFGKTTYVDKTFAPSLAEAEEIFALADKHGTAIQTTSSLRYTEVQDFIAANGGKEAVRHMVAWGPGRSFDEYAIHPTEAVISNMGSEAVALMRRNDGNFSQLIINFTNDRTAIVNVYTNTKTPYSAAVTTAELTEYLTVNTGALFTNMAREMLDFFEAGAPSIPREESLMVRRILDVSMTDDALNGFVELK